MSTHYTRLGSSIALADRRAGHDPRAADDADITAAAGLHEGEADYRAIMRGEVVGYEGEEGVALAQAECIAGYREEAESEE